MAAAPEQAVDDEQADSHVGQCWGPAPGMLNLFQPAPLVFTRQGHSLFLADLLRGASGFLICSGPSLRHHNLQSLGQRGIVTCAVNNAASLVRPNFWTCVDNPGNFCDAIWKDPGILKFVPCCRLEYHYRVRDERGELVDSGHPVGDMPAVVGYRCNTEFNAERWLYEPSFNIGNGSRVSDDDGNNGVRSVMLVALDLQAEFVVEFRIVADEI